MEQSNPWTGLLNRVLDTATSVVPGVVGRRDNVSTELRDVAGTAAPAAQPAATSFPKWIAWTIGVAGIITLIVVLGIFARRS